MKRSCLAWTLLLLVAACAAPSSAQQDTGDALAGDVTASSIVARDGGQLGGDALLLALNLRDTAQDEVREYWEFGAGRIEVTETTRHDVAVANTVPLPDDDEPEVRTTEHRDVLAYVNRTGLQSWLYAAALGRQGDLPRMASELAGPLELVPQQRVHYRVGGDDAVVPEALVSDWFPTINESVPNVGIDLSRGQEVTLIGNVTIEFYDFDIILSDREGEHHYRSGRWSENETGDLPFGGGAAADIYERKIKLEIEDASFSLLTVDRPLRLHYDAVEATTSGSVLIRDAIGEVAFRQEAHRLDGDVLRLEGAALEIAATATEGADQIDSVLRGDADAIAINGREYLAPTGYRAPPESSKVIVWLVVVATVVLLAGVGLAVRHARIDPDILVLQAEDDLAIGRNRGAARKARRALRRDASDLDAAVIQFAGLTGLGRAAKARRTATALIERSGDETGILHLLVGMSLLEEGADDEQVLGKVKEALRLNPGLRHEVAQLGFLGRFKESLTVLMQYDDSSYS